MSTSHIVDILNSRKELDQPIRVQGLAPGASAFFAWKTAEESNRPVVIIASSHDRMNAIANGIHAVNASNQGDRVSLTLPSWTQSPYSTISMSIRIRHTRAATLANLATNSERSIVAIQARSILQSSIPASLFKNYRTELQVGKSIESREHLVRTLTEAGYLKVDPVEDPGTFSVRGEILDVYPPHLSHPVRVEFFDQEVERIRFFDPASQRTLEGRQSLQSLEVFPCREVLINTETYPHLRSQIKGFADEKGIHRSVRDPVLHSFAEGVYPDHADAWIPFAYEKPESILSHIDNPIVIVEDELGCDQAIDEFLARQKELYPETIEAGMILPPPDKLFCQSYQGEFFLDQIRIQDVSEIDEAEGEEEVEHRRESKKQHTVFTRSNADLDTIGGENRTEAILNKLKSWLETDHQVFICSSTASQIERAKHLIPEDLSGRVAFVDQDLLEGFRWPRQKVVYLSVEEFLGTKKSRRQKKTSSQSDWQGMQSLSDLEAGDLIVHIEHGIARYMGLSRMNLLGAPEDFIQLEYANDDKLYIPVYKLNQIQKYAGGSGNAALSRLGNQQFEKTKEKVKEDLKKLAFDLVKVYAERAVQKGPLLQAPEQEIQKFEDEFIFRETTDQLKAIDSTLNDLASGKIMDRLICGDVGFGKTEIAMRAAFSTVMSGKQVAVLVPTTVLALQHAQSFKDRFKHYPVEIESISRFKSRKEQNQVIEDVKEGKIDIVIGTHRLLSKDVDFKSLGLIIVDEEHRFGVEHKEKIKAHRVKTHALTLTATPIPRTLQMALSGLREISLITTPPVDRLPIRTFVSKFDENLIKRALSFEIARGGQVFFLHNRVQGIEKLADQLRELVPEAKFGVAHGQMKEKDIEQMMLKFYNKEIDVLVCTTIVESGLDIPSANTMIINRADTFGLAQLYQLRGRVGRSDRRAYCYLLVSSTGGLTADAKKRLDVIQRFVELGSGFNIASHDLEIRGGGNLLGPQQSGQVAAVGFDLYTELLDEAIREVQGKPPEEKDNKFEPEIKSPYPAFLPEAYVPDVKQRLGLYKNLSNSSSEEEIARLESELNDRFGKLPPEAENLLWTIRLKVLLRTHRIRSVTVGAKKLAFFFDRECKVSPQRVIEAVSKNPSLYRVTPDSRFIATMSHESLKEAFFATEEIVQTLVKN